ncbi:hypothetical protein N7468_006147 [Penicillium chermesinum]|uniref:Uncharacterized protein n=1 Tax=Penicillium chermesinum TaxID=63820 RepID=A0A9W9P0G9_9EURO|nr:uncharacterized protein N7468_006147 [Penicillium chermesinum]KAJ5233191.1 hypothetical protein N7468_006147 [Penicillium chermesinum]KAJ6172825.1 hypothetical protein N7470_001892 [Penicillium chermesinum]
MSFSYAARFVAQTAPKSPSQNPYCVPASLPPEAQADANGVQPLPEDNHTATPREAFIENWKSDNFGRFVGACRAIVDELAMAQPPANGWDEMSPYERVFKQAVWLWGQIFPEVGEIEDLEQQIGLDTRQDTREPRDHSAIDRNGPAHVPVESMNTIMR